jgi:V/A-type H+-transporting ATPase subunit D
MPERDRIAATRSNLLRARDRLARVRKGATVVRKKRQALVGELFRLARPALSAREEIASRADAAYARLGEALAIQGRDALRALGWPERRILVDVRPAQIWGVAVADIALAEPVRRTIDARGAPPSSTGPTAEQAAHELEALVELLIAAAPRELRVARLAAAVAQTSRHLQVLEQRLEPHLLAQIALLARTLEEREREAHLVLKRLQRQRGRG